MQPDNIAVAAAELAARRRTGLQGPRLPDALRPADIETGWKVQQAVGRLLKAEVAGWKCALPGANGFVAAPIYASGVTRAERLVRPSARPVTIEPELAFVLAVDLPPRAAAYSEAEIDQSVGSTNCALEVCTSRYLDHSAVSYPELLADGLVNEGLVLGPPIAGPARATLGLHIQLHVQVEGEPTLELPGTHPAAHPALPLYWLVNFLRVRGLGLRAGQAVITGSYCKPLELPVNRLIQVGFGGLGGIRIQFIHGEST